MNILFSKGSSKKTIELPQETIKDLALEDIVAHACSMKEDREIVMKIFSCIPVEPADMRFRSSIVQDLIGNKDLCEKISHCANDIMALKYYGGSYKLLRRNETNLFNLLEDLRELTIYTDVTEKLASCLKEATISSEGLSMLRDDLEALVNSEDFSSLKKDLADMKNDLGGVQAAYVAVNFTPDLNVEDVAAIEFVPHKLVSKYGVVERLVAMKLISPFETGTKLGRVPDPLLQAIAPKLQKHLKKHYAEIQKTFTQYADFDTKSITEMYEGLLFYLAMAGFGRNLKDKGYDLCFPKIDEKARFDIKGLYNIRLAIDGVKSIVKNDFSFKEDERIFILTGPNRGGKTIIEQAIGVASIMASHGLFVTADSFTGMPFANIFTHFPIDENLTINYGRLGEEAIRVKEIVNQSDNNTLILFNETYSTTSSYDGTYLARDLIRVLKEKGTYVIFNTHLHDLAKDIPEMNKWDGQGDIISIIMEHKDNKNTFMLKRAEPDCCSYAKDIALKYGITYEQMTNNGGDKK